MPTRHLVIKEEKNDTYVAYDKDPNAILAWIQLCIETCSNAFSLSYIKAQTPFQCETQAI